MGRREEPRVIKGGCTEAQLSLLLSSWSMSSRLFSSPPPSLPLFFLVHARPCLPGGPIPLFFLVHARPFLLGGPIPLFSLGSCSRLRLLLLLFWFLRSWPCERPVGGDADGRRSRAGCVVDLHVRTRGAGEGSPAAWEAGTRRDHADGRGRGTRRPLKGGLFFVFVCMLWRRVLPCRNCVSDCAVNKSLLVVGRIAFLVFYLPVNCITALLVLCV